MVTVDDCWMMKDGRDKDGHLVPNATRFPDGIDGLAEKVHKLGLKFGIYSSKSALDRLSYKLKSKAAGTETCAGYPASLEHEETDAADFAAWGVDCKLTQTSQSRLINLRSQI